MNGTKNNVNNRQIRIRIKQLSTLHQLALVLRSHLRKQFTKLNLCSFGHFIRVQIHVDIFFSIVNFTFTFSRNCDKKKPTKRNENREGILRAQDKYTHPR